MRLGDDSLNPTGDLVPGFPDFGDLTLGSSSDASNPMNATAAPGLSLQDTNTINDLFTSAFAPTGLNPNYSDAINSLTSSNFNPFLNSNSPSAPVQSAANSAINLLNTPGAVLYSGLPGSYGNSSGNPPQTPGALSQLEAWFKESSVIKGIANSWIALGAGVLIVLFADKRKRRR